MGAWRTSLSIQDYNSLEQRASTELPLFAQWAFQPAAAQIMGYKTRVSLDDELWPYLDSMANGFFDRAFEVFLDNRISPAELEEFKSLTRLVTRAQEVLFGRIAPSPATLIRGFNIARHIRYLFGDRTLRIFEVAPGAGMLGALLVGKGHGYVGIDAAQAFYMLENRYWAVMFPDRFVELACYNAMPLQELIDAGLMLHIPWWHHVALRRETAPRVDVITCNHALCEMHPWAARFHIRLGAEMLKGPGPKSVLVRRLW